MFVGWTVSGHFGLAEQALGFTVGIAVWRRMLFFAALTGMVWAMIKSSTTEGSWSMLWLAGAAAGAGVFAVAGAGNVFVAGVVFVFVAGAGTVAVAVAVAGAVTASGVGAGAGAGAVTVPGAVAGAVAVALAVFYRRSRNSGQLATFELLFTLLCTAVCLALALGLGASPTLRLAWAHRQLGVWPARCCCSSAY